jgi:hypothetical protein
MEGAKLDQSRHLGARGEGGDLLVELSEVLLGLVSGDELGADFGELG